MSVQRGKAPSNVNSFTSPLPQRTPSSSHCPLLPVSLSGPGQTLWSGLLSAARVFVCSLSHLVAWHAAQCASSPYPAWRSEIKQKNRREDCSLRGGSDHWRNLSALPSGEETARCLNVTPKVAFGYITNVPATGVPGNCIKALTDWQPAKPSFPLI